MTTSHFNTTHRWTAAAGILAAAPAVYFVTLNVLKYELGLLPGIEIAPLHPALLLGGAAAAIGLNAWSVFRPHVSLQEHRLNLSIGWLGCGWNVAVLAIAALCTLTLVAYVVVENLAEAAGW